LTDKLTVVNIVITIVTVITSWKMLVYKILIANASNWIEYLLVSIFYNFSVNSSKVLDFLGLKLVIMKSYSEGSRKNFKKF